MFAIRGNGVHAVRGVVTAPIQRPLLIPCQCIRRLTAPVVVFKRHKAAEVQDGAAIEKVEKAEKSKVKLPRKTSLRRVGLEAEQSRVVIKNKGRVRVIDGGTKVRHVGSQIQLLQANMLLRK
jgi:hypothetical protein